MAKRSRKCKSVKDELLKKAREAMLAAVQIYNNPQITFKAENYIVLSIIAWTYLMHAYFKEIGVDYRIVKSGTEKRRIFKKTKSGAVMHWELERCMNEQKCPLDVETKANLRFLIGIRHEIEHQMTNRIDEEISAKLQACAINFDYYITSLFDKKYNISDQLALAIQFSPISPTQVEILQDNPYITTNVKNFIATFENELDATILSNQKYAYRVLYVPISANRHGQADRVIEFVKPGTELAENIGEQYRHTQVLIRDRDTDKFLTSQIIAKMQEKGYIKFDKQAHTDFWHTRWQNVAIRNKKSTYGALVAGKHWYWHISWLKEVEKYCEKNKDKFC